ncbi:MAG: hypothetical protein Q9176_000516 [Flavoplaca citrina]
MSHSPATPNRLNAEATSSALASIHELSTASGVKLSSLHEPSPASTYGETTAGDSVPATPQDANNDQSAALLGSLRSVSLNDSGERDYGSPLPARGMKTFGRAEQHPTIGRDFALPAGQSPSSQLSNKRSSTSSVLDDRYEQIKHSPTWRHDGRFVRNGEPDSREDPFITSQAKTSDATSSDLQRGFKPREDRANLPLSADTAQAMLPPNACVFVANLTQSKSDDQLEHSVSEVFQAFGNVYVKIRRDGKGMPFAFCQYENVGDAQRAITMGRGLLIDGRACRTEVAKVNRSLYLSKVTGGAIAEDEARQILSRFGAIEKLWYCSQTDLEMFRLPEGVWVMFAFFQDCRDAQAVSGRSIFVLYPAPAYPPKGFRDDPTYRLEQPRMPEDMRTRLNVRSGASPMHREVPRVSPARYGGSPQAAMLRRASDACSIFVGNLPPDATDDKLRELFGMYGRIAHIEIVRKPSVNARVNTFAFLQFHTVEEAEIAARLFYQIDGHRLRVERKVSAESLAQREHMFSGGSPRDRVSSNAHDTMAMLFQHGVSVGMANAGATQSPTSAPPLYTPWSGYQHFGLSPMVTMSAGSRLDNDTQGVPAAHPSTFVPPSFSSGMSPALGQYQMPTITPAQTAHYMPYGNMAHRTTNYQWPPVTSPTKNPSLAKHDMR